MLYILYLCNVYSENGSSNVNFNLIADTECIQWKLFPSWLLVILYPDKAISVFVPTGFFGGAIFGLILQFSIIHEIHVHKSRVDLAGSDLWSFYQFTLLSVCGFMYLYQNNVIHEEDGIPPTFNGFCVFLYILYVGVWAIPDPDIIRLFLYVFLITLPLCVFLFFCLHTIWCLLLSDFVTMYMQIFSHKICDVNLISKMPCFF